MTQSDTDNAVAEFLANGGVIQKIPMGKSGRVEGASMSPWGKPVKKTESPLATAPEEDDE